MTGASILPTIWNLPNVFKEGRSSELPTIYGGMEKTLQRYKITPAGERVLTLLKLNYEQERS